MLILKTNWAICNVVKPTLTATHNFYLMMFLVSFFLNPGSDMNATICLSTKFITVGIEFKRLSNSNWPKLHLKRTIVRKGVSAPHPPFFFHPPVLDIPPIFRNMQPPSPSSWHPSQGNTRFYDDTPESGRLKTINIKPWKPITNKNCVS